MLRDLQTVGFPGTLMTSPQRGVRVLRLDNGRALILLGGTEKEGVFGKVVPASQIRMDGLATDNIH